MEELHKFVFGTIVCDGCARRIDSNLDNERIYEIDDLVEWKLDDLGWVEHQEDKWYCPDCAKDPSHRIHPGEGRIIRERDTLSGLRCDHCGAEFEDSEGFSYWADGSHTEERALDEEWRKMGGKMLCPDCKETCPAMANEDDEVEDIEEVYCSKCPHEHDCYEEVEREIPCASVLCEYVVKTEDGYKECPYLEKRTPLREKCHLPEGKKCPRVEAWEIEKKKIEAKNNEIQAWVKRKID